MYLKIAANSDFLAKLYGDNIKTTGLRQLYDACNFEREGEGEGQKPKTKKKPFEGFLAKTDKNGVTTIRISKKISEDKLRRIKEIMEEE
jgi:hypothetical protein